MFPAHPTVNSIVSACPPIASFMGMIETLWQDLRSGLRVLRHSPAFAVIALLTLGTGIACTTTVFSWIDAVLLHPYPGAAREHELMTLEMVMPGAPNGGVNISWTDFRDYRENLHAFSGLAVYRQSAFTVGEGDRGRMVWGEFVSGNYFSVMGVNALTGRVFTQEEDGQALGAYPVAVISERLWRDAFGGDPAIAGRNVRVNRQMLTIAGVVPKEFRGSSPVLHYDIWVPMTMGVTLGSMSERTFTQRGQRGGLTAIGRLRPGTTLTQANAEAVSIAHRLEQEFPATNQRVGAAVVEARDAHTGVNQYLKAPLAILQTVSFVLLLIVCANIANLLLARSVGRQREFGIRLALGAGRRRVARQVMLETLVLATGGAGVALLILLWTQGTLISMVPNIGIPVSTPFSLNGRILGFTFGVCVAASLISGAWPAVVAFRANLNDVLKESSRGDTAGAGSRRTRGALIVGEVALATVALVGAALFLQSFRNMQAIFPGFDASNVTLGRIYLEAAGFRGDEARLLAGRLQERALAAPGVESATYTDFVPLSTTAGPYMNVRIDGYTPPAGESVAVNRALVAPGYFALLRIPLLEGRDFNALDTRESQPVAIVNESFSKRYFGGRPALGREIRLDGKTCRVVGVARDSKYFSPDEPASGHFYLPFNQFYNSSQELYLLVRGEGALPAIRQAAIESGSAAFHAVALSEYTQLAVFGQKVAANLMAALGVLCLVLAAIGLYGVMSYTVNHRIPEIGIRMAMGARPGDVIGMIVKEGMTLALTGVALGIVCALGAARLVANFLVGLSGWDPVIFAGTAVLLSAVALLATSIPALRATRIDPVLALRK